MFNFLICIEREINLPKEKLIDKSCENNIKNDLIRKYIFIIILLLLMTHTINLFAKTVEQIEVIQAVISPEVSLLNQSLMHKKVFTCSLTNITLVDGSCYKIIDSSILKEIFSSISRCLPYGGWQKKHYRWDKLKKDWK